MNKTIKSSFFITISYIINSILAIIVRKFFLVKYGLYYLGLTGVFANIISLATLVDVGFQNIYMQKLFISIKNNDNSESISVIRYFRKIYFFVSAIILLIGFSCLPLINILVKGNYTSEVIFIFILMLASSISNYIFIHRRVLYSVFQEQFYISYFDIIFNIVFSILKILITLTSSSIKYYFLISLIQVILQNLLIGFMALKRYTFLRNLNSSISRSYLSRKDYLALFLNSFSSFIYSSTDNLIVTKILNIQSAGLLMNYKYIPQVFTDLTSSIFKPIYSYIGLNHTSGKIKRDDEFLYLYSFIRFFIGSIISTCIYILLNDFIRLWFGSEYILPKYISFMVALNFQISLIQGSLFDLIYANGFFKLERDWLVIAAITNLTLSLILTYYFGISGVLIGTFVSQIFIYFGRTRIVFLNIVDGNSSSFLMWSIINFSKFIFITLLISKCTEYFKIQTFPYLIIYSFLILVLTSVFYLLVNIKNIYFINLTQKLSTIFKKTKN